MSNFAASFLQGEEHGIPRWVWLGVIVGGVGVGLYFKNRASNSQPTSILDTAGTQTATGTGPVTINPSNPVTVNPYPFTATTRSKGLFPAGDAEYNGIPIELVPAGVVIGVVPYDSSIILLAPPIQGPASFNGKGYSNTWYSTPGGYINSEDVIGAPN